MVGEELGPVEAELLRRQEAAFEYVEILITRDLADGEYLRVLSDLASEAAKFQGLLVMMNRGYRSLRDRKDQEILELTAEKLGAEQKLAKLHQVMGTGERMGDSDDKIMKEIRKVLWHG